MKPPIPRIRLSPIKLPSTPLIVPQVNQRPADVSVARPEAREALAVPVPGGVPVSEPRVMAGAEPAVAEASAEPKEGLTFLSRAMPVQAAGAEFTLPVPAAPAAGSGERGVEEAVSTGVMTHSSSPALMRASSMVFKWTLIGGTLLVVAFAAMRYLVPIIHEMRAVKTAAPVVVDKSASTAVKAIQATRQVIAKGDANVAYLNEVVGTIESKAVVPPAAPVQKPDVAAAAQPAGGAVAAVGDLGVYREAIARMKVDSVSRGPQPKAFIDGRLVKEGEIINRQLGLRFIGVEEHEHALLFTNAENVTFRKYY